MNKSVNSYEVATSMSGSHGIKDEKNVDSTVQIIQINENISKFLQKNSTRWCFDTKNHLRSLLDQLPPLLLARTRQFESDKDINGISTALIRIMAVSQGMTTASLLMLAYQITALLCKNSLLSVSMSVRLLDKLLSNLGIPFLTTREKEYGHCILLVAMNNIKILQHIIGNNHGSLRDDESPSLYNKIISHMTEVLQTCRDKKQRLLLEKFSHNTTPQGIKRLTEELLLEINLQFLAVEQYQDMYIKNIYRCVLGNSNANYLCEQVEITASISNHLERFFSITGTESMIEELHILTSLVSCLRACAKLYSIQETTMISSLLEYSKIHEITPSNLVKLQVASARHLITLLQDTIMNEISTVNPPTATTNYLRNIITDHEIHLSNQRRVLPFRAILNPFCTLCEICSLSCHIICKASDMIADYILNHSRIPRDDVYELPAQSLINSCVELVCFLNEVERQFLNHFRTEQETTAVSVIKETIAEIMAMFHYQSSIVVNDEEVSQDETSKGSHQIVYNTIGLSPHFGRHILQFATTHMFSKPSSASTCLMIMRDIIPDSIKEDICSLDMASQQLRFYWKDMVTPLVPDTLKLNCWVISNNEAISCMAMDVLYQIMGLFWDSEEEFSGQLKAEIRKEMNSCILHAIGFFRSRDMTYHTKCLMYQNEIIMRRWLKFISNSAYFQDMYDYFTSSLDRVKVSPTEIESFQASHASSFVEFDYSTASQAIFTQDVNYNMEVTTRIQYEETLNNTVCHNKSRMNIGGGKAYNRNEFRDMHGYQSANTSRPPSVHVDDFAAGQSK